LRCTAALPAAVLAAGLLAPRAEAGPWTLGRGHVYAKLSYGHLSTTTLATPDGTRAEIPRFGKHEGYLYVALGLSDRVDALLSANLYRRSSLEGFGREAGLGDVRAGLQARLGRRGPWVFAVRGVVQAPTGDETKGEALLPTGSGAWEGETVASVGRSLWDGRGWTFVEAGYHFRGRRLRDGLVYGGQIGVSLGRRLLLAWNVRGLEPWESTAGEGSVASASGLGDGVTYASFGPTAIVKLGGGVSLQLDADGAVHARNLAKGTAFRIGVSYNR
jgi:hypothetical protein